MSKRNESKKASYRRNRRERRLRIRSIQRRPVDYPKLAGALIDLATSQLAEDGDALTDELAEAEAQAEQERKRAARQRRTERVERQRDEADGETDGSPGGAA